MEDDEEIAAEHGPSSRREALKRLKRRQIISRDEERAKLKTVRRILKKNLADRDPEELKFLDRYSKLANEVLKKNEKKIILQDRLKEKEDDPDVLDAKCNALVDAIQISKHLVVYTGAGISTAASIPDYRGPDGVWTRLSKGENLSSHDLCEAEPTLTHMSLAALYHHGKIKHIVSQNCDGLHIRSGIPAVSLSEVHGNMFIEVCENCDPQRVYLRLFDVTENTGLRRHKTNRRCHLCRADLWDTIVHFGEKRELTYPQNWEAAIDNATKADAILCLGSSLKVLKGYRSLWRMNRTKNKRPNLYIVNLQWTPKDSMATLKINGKVDAILQNVMKKLKIEIPTYKRNYDPMFRLHTALHRDELNTFSTKSLAIKLKEEPTKIIEHAKNGHINTDLTFKCKLESQGKDVKDEGDIEEDRIDTGAKCPGWFGKGFRKNRRRKKKQA